VRPLSNPLYPQGGIAVLRGNLAPGGAIIKTVGRGREAHAPRGACVVFEDAGDLARRIDSRISTSRRTTGWC